MIFLALPFVFVLFVINFPAGLLVYWITTNLWTIVQQTIVRKRLGPMRPPSADGEPPPMSIMDRMLHGRGDSRADDGARAGAAASSGRGNGSASGSPSGEGAQPGAAAASPRKKKKRSGRRR